VLYPAEGIFDFARVTFGIEKVEWSLVVEGPILGEHPRAGGVVGSQHFARKRVEASDAR
jgi:hypothetical protein